MFYFDSYAIIAILKGEETYLKYKVAEMITTRFNLMEVYYWMFNNLGKSKADEFFEETKKFCMVVKDDRIKQAMIFRAQNRNKKLSYVDCIGYILAKFLNIKFLTGDKAFRGMENVEFVQ